MLTHRTNVLLSKEDYQMLSQLAKRQKVSIGKLVRTAVKKTYVKKKRKEKKNERQKLFDEIKKLTKHIDMKGVDYKELVNDGRKY